MYKRNITNYYIQIIPKYQILNLTEVIAPFLHILNNVIMNTTRSCRSIVLKNSCTGKILVTYKKTSAMELFLSQVFSGTFCEAVFLNSFFTEHLQKDAPG